MLTLKNKILSLIESEEVRECVSENFDRLSKKQIIDIVYGSPYSLQQKYDIMNQLAESEKDCGEISYTEYAKRLNTELSLLELQENELFVLELKRIPKHSKYFAATYQLGVFSDIDTPMEIICTKFIVDKHNCWYVLTKFKLDSTHYKPIAKFFVSTDKEILASDYYIGFKYDYGMRSAKISVPIPFKVGDIICIDSRPFAHPINGLVIDCENDAEGASVKCLFFDFWGNIDIRTIEDFSIFINRPEIPLPSPLYRAKTVNEELIGYDKNLLLIKEALAKDKNSAQKICEFVSEYNIDKTYSDLKWETLYTKIIKALIDNR